ncbi:TetR/AcrR family transcriptional regulator [Rothia halotolerans]|uniref:TetR/AcrR family transcriptional regulator n=1 Tax=Rothia halotolerans TaxID=405770 RepID=UPI00101BC8B3|nr:TetR/AcrR family transcriptional regulator [Rothia halotolerans]
MPTLPQQRRPSRPSPARERILAAAGRLFYAEGMTATGIDTITADAGVAKQSLYNNFASKDDLVLAYIERRHEEWLELLRRRSEAAATPLERALAVFDAYIDHAEDAHAGGFRGCGLLNAAAELPAGTPGREAVRRHKEQVERILAECLAEVAEPGPAAAAAEQCALLLEGGVARAGLEGTPARLERARALAAAIVGAL